MSLSLNELESLARKAARGAGYDWGLAEEAGRAVRWLACHRVAGAEALCLVLAARQEGRLCMPVIDNLRGGASAWGALVLCPIALGAAICDFGVLPDQVDFGRVAVPLLLVPAVSAFAARSGQAVQLSAGGLSYWCDADGASLAAANPILPDADVTLKIRPGPARTGGQPGHSRAVVAAGVLGQLTDFAHRTYAPATQASRAGAGASGSSDAD